MKIYLLFSYDQWLSSDSKTLVAVCTSFENMMCKAVEYAKTELNIPSIEDERPEEPDWDSMTDEEIENYQDWEPSPDKDYLEDMTRDMEINRQWSGHRDGFAYEEAELDQFCY